jgi:formylglycine-generating enzyme required for sulfatase activity
MQGSSVTEEGRWDDEYQHKKRIGRTFGIAAKPVTVEQYRLFNKSISPSDQNSRPADLPVGGTSWYDATAYCNWLSKEERIDESQWCYEIKDGMMKPKENYLSLSGYRLPTESEMEYAIRAGALTSRYYGESEKLLVKYAWFHENSQGKTWPVGSLKPNDLGLFDMLGNVYAWCEASYKEYPEGVEVSEDREDRDTIALSKGRVMRGGAYGFCAKFLRSSSRLSNSPNVRSNDNGIRLARTFFLE